MIGRVLSERQGDERIYVATKIPPRGKLWWVDRDFDDIEQFSMIRGILPTMLAALIEPPVVLAPIAYVAFVHEYQPVELTWKIAAHATAGNV